MSEDLSLDFKITGTAEAAAGVKSVESATEQLSGALKTQLEPAAQSAFTAFEKLAKAEGPKALQKGLVDATIAMENFKKAADTAAASGQKIPAGVSNAMKAMQTDIDNGSRKLGQLKDVMGDVASRANQAGQSFEYLKGAGGGLGGMLNALESSSSGALSAIGKLGIASVGLAGIFAVAVEAGKKVGEAFAFVVDKASKLEQTMQKGQQAAQQHAAAMQALNAGLIQNSNTTAGLIANYERYQASQGRMTASVKEFGLEAPRSFQQIEDAAEGMGAALEGAFKKSEKEGLEWAKQNEKAIRDVEADYRRFGEAVPDGIRKAIDALDDFSKATKDAAAANAELNKQSAKQFLDETAEAAKAAAAAMRDMAAATATANAEFAASEQFIKNRSAAIKDGTEVLDQYGNAIEKTKNQESSWTAFQIQVTEATDAQREALHKLLEEQNAYGESIQNTLSVAKGWEDYLANLVDAYQTGATSLLIYKNALVDFRTELLQMFQGATGKAKEALESMIQTIQRLIDTAGAGGVPHSGSSASDALNNAFNTP